MATALLTCVVIAFGQESPSWEEPVRREDATAVVSDGLDDLIAKLAAAQPGDVVWVEADAIDLGDAHDIEIPAGVTLASGRGMLQTGPLLYTNEFEDNDDPDDRRTVFILRDGARVTGLRFRGPSGSTEAQHAEVALTIADAAITRVQVDRNEFYHWTRAGVFIEEAGDPQHPENVRITRNYFHHNQAAGNGYGVNVRKGAYPLIDRNTFDYNRHAISCDGRPETGYHAYGNFVLRGGHDYRYEWHGIPFWVWDQHFDMHGYPHDGDTGGLTVFIRRNTFRGAQKYGPPPPLPGRKTRAAFKLRGTPVGNAYFEHNVLSHDSEEEAIHSDSHKPVITSGNKYGVNTSNEISVGQFDGSSRPDVFQATGAGWYYSSGGLTEWRFLNNQSDRLPNMRLADFDGNGTSDLLAVHGTDWVVSYDGTGAWQTLATNQPYAVSELAVGEFDGDGRADLFRADGERWWIWQSSTQSWSAVNVSGKRLDDLRLADLTCDGITDVLAEIDEQWRISDGARSTWTSFNEAFFRLDHLVFADFDGNGCTDIAWTLTTQPPPPAPGVPRPPPVYNWYWARDGSGPRQILHQSAGGWLGQNRVADFNRDGRADVLRYRPEPAPLHVFEISRGGSEPWAKYSWRSMR
jgi:hypothetical protein